MSFLEQCDILIKIVTTLCECGFDVLFRVEEDVVDVCCRETIILRLEFLNLLSASSLSLLSASDGTI